MGIEVELVDSCMVGSYDVGTQVVANHEALLGSTLRDGECIVEELGVGFQ